LRVLDQLLSVFVDSGVGEKRRRLGAQVVVAVDVLSQQRHLFDLNVVKFWLESNSQHFILFVAFEWDQ
jgi:hypothetical protein